MQDAKFSTTIVLFVGKTLGCIEVEMGENILYQKWGSNFAFQKRLKTPANFSQ